MKTSIALTVACTLVAFAIGASYADTNDSIAKRILEIYPNADTNGDGERLQAIRKR